MAKNSGCWANALDHCRGSLTGEHLISVAVWAVREGQRANRKNKLRRQVRIDGDPRRAGKSHTTNVRGLTADILCEHHNNSSNALDEEGGRFARAIEDWHRANKARSWAPRLNWNRRTCTVNGPLLERWFLKTAINNAFVHGDL
ncbi:MAG: hypothetical protein M3680_17510 [Myxococcota bacterium]|nr:hypothetical protein [Myxococcota bacterium]